MWSSLKARSHFTFYKFNIEGSGEGINRKLSIEKIEKRLGKLVNRPEFQYRTEGAVIFEVSKSSFPQDCCHFKFEEGLLHLKV